MDKKGFELSINFIIVMILMIVIIGLGLSMFTKIFNDGREIVNRVDDSTQTQLDNVLDSGEPFVIIGDVQTIEPGESADIKVGINNELGYTMNGRLYIEPLSNFDILYVDEIENLAQGEREYKKVRIIPEGAGEGTHIFDVAVCYEPQGSVDPDSSPCNTNQNRYYMLKKVYINIR